MKMEGPKPKEDVKWARMWDPTPLIHRQPLPLSPGRSCPWMPEPRPLNKAPSYWRLGLVCDSSRVVGSSLSLVGTQVWQRAAPQRQGGQLSPECGRGPVGLVGGGAGRGSEVHAGSLLG